MHTESDSRPISQLHMGILLFAAAAGAVFRFLPVIQSGFPLNDGGFFVVLATDLIDANFRLPAFTSYNQLAIPFAYPPMGIYLLAGLHRITNIPLVDLIRWLPPLISSLAVPAFYLLAVELLNSRRAAALSATALALLPVLMAWMNYGAGLTRSLGFLFMILALARYARLLRANQPGQWLPAGVFTGLTVLSHLEWAAFLAFSLVVFWLFLPSQRWTALREIASSAVLALLISLPWWLRVMLAHGLAPFLAALAAGEPASPAFQLSVFLHASGEPYLSLIAVLAMAGAAAHLLQRSWLLPVWYLLIPLFNERATYFMLSLPVALMAASFLNDFLVRGLGQRLSACFPSLALDRPLRKNLFSLALLLPLAGIAFWNAWGYTVDLRALYAPFVQPATREAMAWIRDKTPPNASVLVLPARGWYQDANAEWLPWLARRASPSTVQGTEWLPGGEFGRRIAHHQSLLSCRDAPASCIASWAAQTGQRIDYILVPSDFEGSLRAALSVAESYKPVYTRAGAAVYQKIP